MHRNTEHMLCSNEVANSFSSKVKTSHRMGLKLYYPETDAWHSDHLATTSLRLKLNISTMFTYLQARHGDLETAACWTPLFARGVQNCVSSIETKEGTIRFNRNGSSNFSAQEWVQTIKMLAGKTGTLMRFQMCL
jgi:hypothetical protein